ncbi:MAG TPA: hypothetical protein VFF70_13700 [Anaerolineae bacterium]|nr:hypothetical protein [Anaerolineae bacterium]
MNSSLKQTLRRDLLVLLFFTALTLFMTYPLITKIGSVYAGNNEDLWTFQWDNWWTRTALSHGLDTLYTNYQFYPNGVSLAAHSLSFYNSILWIPLSAIFGDIAAYNITILLTFILSGYTMFKLADYLLTADSRRQTADGHDPTAVGGQRSSVAALIAGIIYAFAPYHFSQSLGHVSLASVQWFPLLALFILKATRERSWRNAIAIGLVTFLLTATRLQFIVLGAAVFAIFVAVDWIVSHREWVRGAIVRLIVGAAIGLILSLPIALPAAQLYAGSASPDELIADEQTWGQTDLLAYALPMTYHPIFGPIVQPLYTHFAKNQAWMPYLGLIVVAFAVWGSARSKRRSLPWLVIGLFLFIMALGPFLLVNGVQYQNIRLPYALIGDKFPLNTLRSPDRYNLLLPLVLATLAAFGIADILKRLSGRGKTIGAMLIGGMIVFEYLGLPYPTIEPLPSSLFYATIAHDSTPYAILDVPLARSDTKRYLYYQTLHNHPIIEGRVARVPDEAYQLFNSIPLLSQWRHTLDAKRPIDLGAQLNLLAQQNIHYIILHKDLATSLQTAQLRDYFTREPVFEDDQIAVYSTQPIEDSITAIGGSIGNINSWVNVSGPDQPIEVRMRWSSTQVIDRDYSYRLALIDPAGSIVLSSTDRLTPTTSTWLTGTLVTPVYRLIPKTRVPIGQFKLQLNILDADQVLGSIDLPQRIVNDQNWIMSVTDEPHARFGSSIELRAADVSRRGNVLVLWLHWHALTTPGVDTKYFVHILDANGDVVAQDDGVYGQYTKPSSEWQAGQYISDQLEIPLWNLIPGDYRISIGVTDPETNERLNAIDSARQPLDQNRYIFSEMIKINK